MLPTPVSAPYLTPSWVWWTVSILGVIALALATVLSWAISQHYRQLSQDTKDPKDGGFWMPTAATEDSIMRAPGVVLESTNGRHRGVSVRAGTSVDQFGVWGHLEANRHSPWPPWGPVKATFREIATGSRRSVEIMLTDWRSERRSDRQLIFATDNARNGAQISDTEQVEVTEPQTVDTIPWRLVQTYRTPFLASNMHTAHQSFLSLNPGIRSCFYGNRTMREFTEKHFDSKTLAALDKLRPGAYKSDLFRICELFVNGGVYADVTMICLEPLEYLLKDVDLVVVRDSPFRDLSYLYNAFMCAKPGCPFLKCAIEDVVKKVLSEDYSRDPLSITGPGAFGRSLNRYAGRDEKSPHAFGVSMYGQLRVLVLDNNSNTVQDMVRNVPVIRNKYGEWTGDRIGNPHYGVLWISRQVFLRELAPSERYTPINPTYTENGIPLCLYQTWETVYMMPGMLDNVRATRAVHVAEGWGFHFADDSRRRQDIALMSQPRIMQAFDQVLAGGMRAHLWGLAMLVRHGGVYADTHIVAHRSLTQCLGAGTKAVISVLNTLGASGHVWACVPGHPFFQAVLNEALDAILIRKDDRTNSADWFRRISSHAEVDIYHGVTLLPVIDDCITVNEILMVTDRYSGYNSERALMGGEDPKHMTRHGHVLVPSLT